jgi:hypothetical protein
MGMLLNSKRSHGLFVVSGCSRAIQDGRSSDRLSDWDWVGLLYYTIVAVLSI